MDFLGFDVPSKAFNLNDLLAAERNRGSSAVTSAVTPSPTQRTTPRPPASASGSRSEPALPAAAATSTTGDQKIKLKCHEHVEQPQSLKLSGIT